MSFRVFSVIRGSFASVPTRLDANESSFWPVHEERNARLRVSKVDFFACSASLREIPNVDNRFHAKAQSTQRKKPIKNLTHSHQVLSEQKQTIHELH